MSPLTSYVLQTLVTLLGVVALVVVLLYGARRAGIGRASGPLEIVGRLPLDGRHAVYLIRVAGTVYVVASSESGLAKLGEIDAADLPDPGPATPTRGFGRWLGNRRGGSDGPR
jgi:flagellar biogenesis protein FliO